MGCGVGVVWCETKRERIQHMRTYVHTHILYVCVSICACTLAGVRMYICVCVSVCALDHVLLSATSVATLSLCMTKMSALLPKWPPPLCRGMWRMSSCSQGVSGQGQPDTHAGSMGEGVSVSICWCPSCQQIKHMTSPPPPPPPPPVLCTCRGALVRCNGCVDQGHLCVHVNVVCLCMHCVCSHTQSI